MSLIAVVLVCLLVLSAGPAPAQQPDTVAGAGVAQDASPSPRYQFALRLGAAVMSANGLGTLRPALDAGAGLLWADRSGLLLQYFQESAYRVPQQTSSGAFTRRFVLAGFEWSPRPLLLERLGDRQWAVRVMLGAVFREQLRAGAAAGLGLNFRYALNRSVAATASADGFLTLLPNDPVPRCDNATIVPNCNPFASSGTFRPEGQLAIGFEFRL